MRRDLPVVFLLSQVFGLADTVAAEVPAEASISPPAQPAASLQSMGIRSSQGVIAYPASFFAEFQPSSAFDMVERLPGFNFQEGDTEVRGFAGALGNVLVNGQRPTSKTVSLEDVLRRIPVAGVERIEVIRGGAPGINMQGQSVVANVIRSAGGATTLTSEVSTTLTSHHDPGVGLRLETTRSQGALSLDGALEYSDAKDYGTTGFGRLTRRGPDGGMLALSDFAADWGERKVGANGAAEYQTSRGLLRFNFGAMRRHMERFDTSTPFGGTTSGIDERVFTDMVLYDIEAGVDYEHAFSEALSGRMLLMQIIKDDVIGAYSARPVSRQDTDEEKQQGESILRSSLTYMLPSGMSIEGGAEAAYNFMDVDSSLLLNGELVPLPLAKVKVEEERAEAFLEARWKPSERLSADVGIRYEVSTISQSGDSDARRTLSYPKPRALISYNFGDGMQFRLRGERTVSQLDFRDFASQASLEAGTLSGGNAELRPETAWELEGAIEKRFWGSGAVVLAYMHSEVRDVMDLVPVDGFDAPGNIGDGTRDQVKLSVASPLDRLGIAGATLRFDGIWTWSDVTDPVTAEVRRISNHLPNEVDVLLTKEFPGLQSSLTIFWANRHRDTSYRINEIRTDILDPYARIYWDWNARPDLLLRLTVNNVTARPKVRTRTLFTGPRSAGLVAFDEHRYADATRSFEIKLRKTF